MNRHVVQLVLLAFLGFTSMTSFTVAANAGQIPDTDISDRNSNYTATEIAKPIQSSEIANTYQSTRSELTVTRAKAPNASDVVLSGSYITIGGRTISMYDTGSTADDAGTRVARYSNSFLYGHNTGAVFGHLAGLPEGTTFSVTVNGQTTDYRISEKVIYNHEYTARGTELLYPDGLPGRNFMSNIINARATTVSGTRQHSLAIMTCHGVSWGGGDASQRLVVFADRI